MRVEKKTKLMKITHEIPEPWRSSFAQWLGAIQQHRLEIEVLTRSISLSAGVLAKEAGLPENLQLSADGTCLTGEVEEKKDA
jgi:hypothetical protein